MFIFDVRCDSKVNLRGLELPELRTAAQLLGFAGDQENYDEKAPHFRWTGHVGLRFKGQEAGGFSLY